MKTKLKAFYNLPRLLFIKEKPFTINQVSKHKISTKNKWLNPKDNFGKLERGVE
jgi:hypothetical protein